MPLSEETDGGNFLSLHLLKEATMEKVTLIVHECFTGEQDPEEVFTAVFLSNAAALTENANSGIVVVKHLFVRII